MKVITLLSKIVLFIAFLNIFAWAVYHVNTGGGKLGDLTKPIQEFSRFPDLVMAVQKEVKKPERLMYIDSSFEATNKLTYDVFALNGHFDYGTWRWRIELTNLKNDELLHSWELGAEQYVNTLDRIYPHAEPRNCILLADKSIIIHNDETKNLYRLSADSDIMWHNTEHIFHHCHNLDADGNIWACTREKVQVKPQNTQYWDNMITKVDVNTGKILFHKSLSEVFLENKMEYILHGIGNVVARSGEDPMHLNEIQPALTDGTYWKKDDLFISLRHRSAILQYRPSTNQLIRVLQGPFFNQHDIDIQSDSTISLFNNNASSLMYNYEKIEKNSQNLLPNKTLTKNANVMVYNFKDSTYTSLYPQKFVTNKIYTETQGLHHIMKNGDLFVESFNQGRVYIFNSEETVFKRYFNKPKDGLVEHPYWVRIYEDLDFLNEAE